jgi:hypothetical protein
MGWFVSAFAADVIPIRPRVVGVVQVVAPGFRYVETIVVGGRLYVVHARPPELM